MARPTVERRAATSAAQFIVGIDQLPTNRHSGHLRHESRVNLGWDARTGSFLGWYVNFELSPQSTPTGIVSKDLVLDIWVDQDRSWRWKDRDDFYQALADRILDPGVQAPIEAEAELILQELTAGSGPFTDEWIDFRGDPCWDFPQLPVQYALGGDQWQLPIGDQPVG